MSATSDIAALYDRIASSYERWWAPVIRPATLHVLDLVAHRVAARPEAVILDIGAGTGPLLRAAVARWPRVRALGVDPSRSMLDLGRAEAAGSLEASACRRISWLPGVAQQLPVADGSVDVAVSSFTVQYLHNRVAALREAYRVCRPGAAVAVVTWLEGDSSFVPWQLFDSLLHELGIVRPPSSEGHRFRSLPSSAALLRRAGFCEVRAAGGLVDYQWTVDALVHCAVESEERELFDSLSEDAGRRLASLWRVQLERLSAADLRYRDTIAYVTGRRP